MTVFSGLLFHPVIRFPAIDASCQLGEKGHKISGSNRGDSPSLMWQDLWHPQALKGFCGWLFASRVFCTSATGCGSGCGSFTAKATQQQLQCSPNDKWPQHLCTLKSTFQSLDTTDATWLSGISCVCCPALSWKTTEPLLRE